MSFFQFGKNSLKIPQSFHKNNRNNLIKKLQSETELAKEKCVAIFMGGVEMPTQDTDTMWDDQKQESFFNQLWGAREPSLLAIIDFNNLISKETSEYLFIPRHEKSQEAWVGPIKTPDEWEREQEVERVMQTDEIADLLKGNDLRNLLPINGKSGNQTYLEQPKFEGSKDFIFLDSEVMRTILTEMRVIKQPLELDIMRFVNDVSSDAHIKVMQAAKEHVEKEEFQAEALFKFECFKHGCKRVGYQCICCSGERNSHLHYGSPDFPNDKVSTIGDLRLLDMGCEQHGQTADITCTFPNNGFFSKEQRDIQNIVWDAVEKVENALKPGVVQQDMHVLACRIIVEGLVNLDILKGDTTDLMVKGLHRCFMAHYLGHQLGMDVHDVGAQHLGKSLPLRENMVLTVEPGIQFTNQLIAEMLDDPKTKDCINVDVLNKQRQVGGVRIEDDVVITADGCQVLTNVPRKIEDIEKVMNGEVWNPKVKYRVYKNIYNVK